MLSLTWIVLTSLRRSNEATTNIFSVSYFMKILRKYVKRDIKITYHLKYVNDP